MHREQSQNFLIVPHVKVLSTKYSVWWSEAMFRIFMFKKRMILYLYFDEENHLSGIKTCERHIHDIFKKFALNSVEVAALLECSELQGKLQNVKNYQFIPKSYHCVLVP